MSNTDGDPLEFHRLIYEVASADEAFGKLQGLCVTTASEDLLAETKRDASGRIVSVEIYLFDSIDTDGFIMFC